MNKYEFDSVRWLRNVAEVQSHRAGAGAAMLRENMLKCTVEIERLRAESEVLRVRVARLEEAGRKLLESCESADADGDLSERVSGDLMFNFRRALEEK